MDARGRTRRTRTLVGAVIAAAALIGTVAAPPGSAGASVASGPTTSGQVGVAATEGFLSRFPFDPQGWGPLEPTDPAFWTSDGKPNGGFAVQRGTGGVTGAVSPSAWAGDRRGLYNGTISFDLKLGLGVSSPFFEVQFNSDDEEVPYFFRQISNPNGTLPQWTRFTFPIRAKRGWLVPNDGGPLTGARPSDFTAVLSSLTSVSIAGFTQGTSDTLFIDNVKIASRVNVRLSLAYRGSRFFGRVTPAGGCAVERPVTLFRKRPGPDSRIGTATTDRRGEWAVNKRNAPDGVYYARVPGGYIQGGGDCSAAGARLTLGD